MKINKKILFLVILAVLFLSSVIPASAALYRPASPVSLVTFMGNLRTMTWDIFIGLAVICIVVTGILFMTAQGDPEKLKTARASLIWGVIGIVVAIIAYSIETIIQAGLMAP